MPFMMCGRCTRSRHCSREPPSARRVSVVIAIDMKPPEFLKSSKDAPDIFAHRYKKRHAFCVNDGGCNFKFKKLSNVTDDYSLASHEVDADHAHLSLRLRLIKNENAFEFAYNYKPVS